MSITASLFYIECEASVLQACAAADELKGNLDSEFAAVRDFIAAFCRCMDYVQHARMLVVGYPFTPDVLAIANLVSQTCGTC